MLFYFLILCTFLAVYSLFVDKYKLVIVPLSIICLWWFGIDTRDKLMIQRVPLSMVINMTFFIIATMFLAVTFNWKNKINSPIKLLLKFYGFIFIIGLWGLVFLSHDSYNGTFYFLNTAILPVLIIFNFWFFINDEEELEKSIKFFLLTTVVFSFILLINFATRQFAADSLINTTYGTRIGGIPQFPFNFRVYYDPVSLGVVLSDIFPLFLAYMIFKLSKKFSYLWLSTLILLLVVIFFTGTRSAWVALVISSAFVLIFNKQGIKKTKLLFIVALLFAVLYQLFSKDINLTIITRLQSLEQVQKDQNLQGRIDLFLEGLRVAINNPFGIGFGRLNREIIYEHNFYTYILLGLGFIGLILYLLVFGVIFNCLKKTFKSGDIFYKNIALGGLGVLMAFLINGLADNSISENFQANGVFIALALAMVSYRLNLIKGPANEK